jgi:preprotein translocase subunit SecF
LIRSGAIAILAAVFAMLIYIWFRFEWQFSLGAVVALIHDVILTIGVFSITQLELHRELEQQQLQEKIATQI